MSDYAVTINLPDHKRGDQWIGIAEIGPVTITGITKGELSRIRCHFVKGTKKFKLDSQPGADGLIVIDDSTTWEAHVDPITDFPLTPGEWSWDMEFTHDGEISPITCYKGTLTVHDDTTR